MSSTLTAELIGPQYANEDPFSKQARLLQSVWRCRMEAQMGTGPTRTSTKEFGNMLAAGHEKANFLLDETFQYARHRVANKRTGETIDDFRLMRNMLSSMPMCFNLFHPLALLNQVATAAVARFFDATFPDLKISNVVAIRIEVAPFPASEYTDDKSAFDAMVLYEDQRGLLSLLAFETKYVEALGANVAKNNETKLKVAKGIKVFSREGLSVVKAGSPQLYRNFLLAEAYRVRHNLHCSTSVVLSPRGNTSSALEVTALQENLLPEYKSKIRMVSLEDFLSASSDTWPDRFQTWKRSFHERYLAFDALGRYTDR